MESMPTSAPDMGAPKSNRNTMIYIVVAIVLCCCCVAAGVGGYYGYQGYVAAQQVYEDVQDFEIPTSIPLDPNDPNSPDITVPGFDTSGEAPSGGLADDTNRYTAWVTVQLIAALSGCAQPTVDGTTIDVVQQPDASGQWVEEWGVNCGDGTSMPVNVTFMTTNGITTIVDVSPK